MSKHTSYNTQFFVGIVENRMDPLKLGRCQVRIIGLHIHDKAILPTDELPWAVPMGPVTSASMNGIGHAPIGPVEGTSVVIMFHDYPDNQQPVIIGTIGGIPQAENVYVGIEKDDAIFKDNSGTTQPVPTTAREAAEVAPTPSASDKNPETIPASTRSDSIPTTPPPSWKGDKNKAAAGIAALIAACDKAGLTSKEAKCAVLAIAGGECGWIPQQEGYSYSAESLQTTFASTFKGKPDLAARYARWKGTRESFFDFVYAPENNGRQLGNTQAGDGGKYFGRGFIQLTGRSNYTRYSKLSGVDILNNPELLNSDINASALIAITYIKTVTSKAVSINDHPAYFYAVKKAIGHDTGNGAAVRLSYYEYFYGAKTPETADATTKDAATPTPPPTTQSATNFTPGPSDTAAVIGFKDPNNKYPLKQLVNEPDTHRLARGIYKGTIVPIKDSKRDIGVPIAFSGEFSQPTIPYGAKYPHNHTYETESGHIQEYDDTPGYERTHRYHRKGTFEEIDANGTRVIRIVGDSYQILDRNGFIHISGECNITVDGNTNIFARADANIEVSGSARMDVGGNYNLNVVGNMEVSVGGELKMWSTGTASLQSAADTHIAAGGSLYGSATSDTNITAGGNLFNSADGDVNVTAGGNFNADAGNVFLNSETSSAGTDATEYQLAAPTSRAALSVRYPYLTSPPLLGEQEYQFENEEDWNTPAGQAARQDIVKKYGENDANNTPAAEEVKSSGGTNTTLPANCSVIAATQKFTNDFRISPSFTLGMLIDGGVDGKNRLQAQNGLTIQEIVCNLSQLCSNILEPLIAKGLLPGGAGGYKTQWQINSGFRSTSNAVSTSTSDHPYGRACDITLLPYDASKAKRNYELIQQIEKIVPYDQIIMEYKSGGSNWIHIGFRGPDTKGPGRNRKMAFTMLDGKTYKSNGFSLL